MTMFLYALKASETKRQIHADSSISWIRKIKSKKLEEKELYIEIGLHTNNVTDYLRCNNFKVIEYIYAMIYFNLYKWYDLYFVAVEKFD